MIELKDKWYNNLKYCISIYYINYKIVTLFYSTNLLLYKYIYMFAM